MNSPIRGHTIIEKFSDYSDVAFAIILLARDDIGGIIKSSPESLQPLARQNVIFEFGFFSLFVPENHYKIL